MNASCAAVVDAAWDAVSEGRAEVVPPIASMLDACGRAAAHDCVHALACRARTHALRDACALPPPGALDDHGARCTAH